MLTIGLFLILHARSAYCNVFKDSSMFESAGLTHAIMMYANCHQASIEANALAYSPCMARVIFAQHTYYIAQAEQTQIGVNAFLESNAHGFCFRLTLRAGQVD